MPNVSSPRIGFRLNAMAPTPPPAVFPNDYCSGLTDCINKTAFVARANLGSAASWWMIEAPNAGANVHVSTKPSSWTNPDRNVTTFMAATVGGTRPIIYNTDMDWLIGLARERLTRDRQTDWTGFNARTISNHVRAGFGLPPI